MSARIQSRRAASKEALKQMHILLEGDEEQETVEIPDDDDDDDVIYCNLMLFFKITFKILGNRN